MNARNTVRPYIPAGMIAIVALVAGCASGPTIISNSAPGFRLADYQTFSFLQPLSTDNGNVRTILSTEIMAPARRELEAAGLRYEERGGDLLVNFAVSTRETMQTRSSPSTGASVRYGAGSYGTWGGYSMSVSTNEVVQHTEGTLAIDIVDASREQLVWEGAATGRITDKARQNRAQAIDLAVSDILAEFPRVLDTGSAQ
jgi:hypothetical protein